MLYRNYREIFQKTRINYFYPKKKYPNLEYITNSPIQKSIKNKYTGEDLIVMWVEWGGIGFRRLDILDVNSFRGFSNDYKTFINTISSVYDEDLYNSNSCKKYNLHENYYSISSTGDRLHRPVEYLNYLKILTSKLSLIPREPQSNSPLILPESGFTLDIDSNYSLYNKDTNKEYSTYVSIHSDFNNKYYLEAGVSKPLYSINNEKDVQNFESTTKSFYFDYDDVPPQLKGFIDDENSKLVLYFTLDLDEISDYEEYVFALPVHFLKALSSVF